MNRFSLILLALFTILTADELSFGEPQTKQPPSKQKRTHSLQLLSSKSLDNALTAVQKVPEKYRDGVAIYQVGDYFATRYIDIYSKESLPGIIHDFQNAGFSSPIAFKFNPKRVPLKNTKPITQSPPTIQTNSPTISQHDKTTLILDAQKAYEQNDFTQATIYYEMLSASGNKDRQVHLNLSYLYGKEGSFSTLERLIEKKRGVTNYLYAYGIGALESGRTDLYNDLSPHLIYDKSGKLALLCGYFFERQKNSDKASSFYTMAYNANPSDPYILYAYARNTDLKGDREKAIYLYTQILSLSGDFESIRTIAQSRIRFLRSLQ